MTDDRRNSETHLEDLLAQLPTNATLFIEQGQLASITGLTGRELERWARRVAQGHFCELSVDDHLASASGIHGFAFRRCQQFSAPPLRN